MNGFNLTGKLAAVAMVTVMLASTVLAANGMTTWTFKKGGFEVAMPGEPRYELVNTPEGPAHVWKVATQGQGYFVAYMDLPGADLSVQARGFAKGFEGRITKEGSFQIAVGESASGKFYYYNTSAGNRVYHWYFVTNSSVAIGPEARTFVESFRLLQ